MEDTITEIQFEIQYRDGHPHVPDIRSIFTLLKVDKAHEKLEMEFAPHRIDVIAYKAHRYLA